MSFLKGSFFSERKTCFGKKKKTSASSFCLIKRQLTSNSISYLWDSDAFNIFLLFLLSLGVSSKKKTFSHVRAPVRVLDALRGRKL